MWLSGSASVVVNLGLSVATSSSRLARDTLLGPSNNGATLGTFRHGTGFWVNRSGAHPKRFHSDATLGDFRYGAASGANRCGGSGSQMSIFIVMMNIIMLLYEAPIAQLKQYTVG